MTSTYTRADYEADRAAALATREAAYAEAFRTYNVAYFRICADYQRALEHLEAAIEARVRRHCQAVMLSADAWNILAQRRDMYLKPHKEVDRAAREAAWEAYGVTISEIEAKWMEAQRAARH